MNNEVVDIKKIVNKKCLLGMVAESRCLANILSFHSIKLIQDVQRIYWYYGNVSRLSIDSSNVDFNLNATDF